MYLATNRAATNQGVMDMFGWLKRRTKGDHEATKSAATPVASAGDPTPPAPQPMASAAMPESPTRPCSKSQAPAKPAPVRVPGPSRTGNKDIVVPPGHRDPKPRVGMPALELGPKSRRRGVVTLVHADGQYVVARLSSGAGRTYMRQPDGTYRLAGISIGKPPRLVLGLK